jgi:hypothetical protein
LTKDIPLEIMGLSSGVIISGAAALNSWSKTLPESVPARLSAASRRNVLVADVSSFALPIDVIPAARGYGIPIHPMTTELFVGNIVQPIAGWPNTGYGKLLRATQLTADDKVTFAIEGRNVAAWQDEPDLQAFAYWAVDWAAQTFLVAKKNVADNELVLFGSGSPYGIKAGQRARIENALAELDAPGEWYLDRSAAMLYFFPPAGFGGKAEISVAPMLLQITNSDNVLVHDLTFEKSRGDAIRIASSNNIVIDKATIRLTGSRAVVVENSATSGIRNSLIEDNGEGGAYLGGGNRQTLQAAGNFVENCTIRRFSRLVKTYRYAVEMAGVGQRVVDSRLSDSPHSAIFFKGNDHLISNNEIFNVVRETGDAGAIYVGRDYTAMGTVIEKNFLHDITAQSNAREVKGVYLDDQASGTTIRNNIFARVQQPVFVGGGRVNTIENNLFFRSSPAIHLDARGLNGDRSDTLALQQGLNAVPYRGPIYASHYPLLANIREDDIGAPKYNTFRNNLVIGGLMLSIETKAKPGISVVNNKLADETAFVKAMPPNMRLTPADFAIVAGVDVRNTVSIQGAALRASPVSQ